MSTPNLSEIQMTEAKTAEDIIELIIEHQGTIELIVDHQVTCDGWISSETVENMRNFNGWAIGDVTLIEPATENILKQVENAWIELLNGDGDADKDSRKQHFLFFQQDNVIKCGQGAAYASHEEMMHYAIEHELHQPVWYVEEFRYPTDPDTGEYTDEDYERWIPQAGHTIPMRDMSDGTTNRMLIERGEKAKKLWKEHGKW